MTAKEVEHFLIEHDFEYVKDDMFPFWQKRNSHVGVSDAYIQEDPARAYEYIAEKLVPNA